MISLRPNLLFTALNILLILAMISACKKEKTDWERCTDCDAEQLVGAYAGSADYYRYTDSVNYVLTNSNEVYFNLSKGTSDLQIQTGVINLFSASFSGIYNNTYYISFASGSQNLNATIWKKEGELKITGQVKKMTLVQGKPQLSELFDFEVYKKQE